VKIKLTHLVCGREVLVQQVVDNQGHCPWDGIAFQASYTAVLVADLQQAELAGNALEGALERIAGLDPAFVVDEESVLGRIRASLDDLAKGRKPAPA
jgi:hypothetical protein